MANVLEWLRKHNKSALIESVKVFLSYLIEVTPEEWEKIISYVEEGESNAKVQGKNSQTKYFTSTTSSSSSETCKLNNKFAPPKQKELASNIFGSPLTEASLKQASLLIDFLNEEDNYMLEGIFRKSGTQERQQDLRYMLNNGVRVDLKANRFTPVDTSCVLKEFIQKLPEPLLTNNHFELHFELASTIRNETPPEEIETKNTKRLKIIQLLLHLIPETNRNLFMSLMSLLNRVARKVEVTKMDERSLATIFGSHILCPRTWTPKQVQKNVEIITDAMEFLLLNYDHLFNGPDELVIEAKQKYQKYLTQKKMIGAGGDSLNNGQEEEVNENKSVITFCQRKEAQETTTDQSLAELYAQVQAMPDTPHKKKLIRQFNRQNGFGTPMQVTKGSTSSKWKNLIPPMLRPKH